MRLVRDIPLEVGWLPWCFEPGAWRLVVVVKATFDLPAEGACTLSAVQAPLEGDAFWDDDIERAPRYDSDLALLKPRAEWWVTGTLRSREPIRELTCRAKVGANEVRFAVVGNRSWRSEGGFTPPEPFMEMPLGWDRCFGGPSVSSNVFGRGAEGPESPLPNIERLDALVQSPRDRPAPVAAWPIPRAWSSRTAHLGRRYDGSYLRDRWPFFSEDFSYRYFQGAPEALQQEAMFREDERIELDNLHPKHFRVRAHLPGLRPRVLLHEREAVSGPLREVDLALDTIVIDAGEGKAHALWRGSAAQRSERPDEHIHLFLTANQGGAWRGPSELYTAFVEAWRESFEDVQAHEPEPPPEPAPVDEAAAPVEAPAPEPPLPDPLESIRASLIEAGMPEEAVAALFEHEPAPPPSPEEQAQTRTRAIAALEGLGHADLAAQLREAEPGSEPETPPSAPTVEPPPGLFTPEERRQEVIARLEAGQSLAGLDLADADLSLLDLSGQDLSGSVLARADLSHTHLMRANLDGCVLDEAKLEGASFREASLAAASLSEVDASRVDFSGANVGHAVFRHATLIAANFRGAFGKGMELAECIAIEANFEEANLEEAELGKSNFDEANLSRATMSRAELGGVSARHANFDFIEAENLRAGDGADFSEASIRGAKLARSCFDRAILIGTRFTGGELTGASFEQARLEGAVFDAVSARGATFTEASAAAASFAGADLHEARLEGTALAHARFDGANLFGAELWRADTREASFTDANIERTKLQ